MVPPRTFAWLFLDMNSFFASAEQHLRPELRNHPVGIVPVESDFTSLIAASHEAKALGVKMGTSVPEAKAVCPSIRLVKARPDEYVRLHHAVARSIDRCAPIHKAYSIDEWAIRLCPRTCQQQAATQLATAMRAAITEDHGEYLPCSIGIAPTRLLAKIACELHKPRGLTILHTDDLPARLAHWKPEDLCGIGRNMAARLENHGVRSIEALWNMTRHECIGVWGSITGGEWWDGFHGHDAPEVPTRRHSMGHANVLDPKLRNESGARAMLVRLTCRLGARLRYEGYLASGMTINLSYPGDDHFHAKLSLPQISDTPSLLQSLYTLWDAPQRPRARPMKVSVTVWGLMLASQATGSLFESREHGSRLSQALDAARRKWGLSSLYFGSMHDCRQHMDDKIAFGKIPDPNIQPN